MKHIPATLPLYFMVLLTIHARGSSNSQTQLNLMKISKTSTTAENAMVQYEFTLQSGTPINSIHCIILNVMRDSQQTNYENSNVSTISENTTIPFLVAADEFHPGEEVTLTMTVHNATQHTLAYVVQQWLPLEINPELAWVGQSDNPNHKPWLRVKTDFNITIDDHPCNIDSSSCYFLQFKGEANLEICTKANDRSKELLDFYQCDETLTPKNSSDISSVTDIILTHKREGDFDLEMIASYDPNSKSMDILIYDEKDPTSYNITQCTIDEATSPCVASIKDELPEKPVRILLVGLNDAETVTESTELEFIDYKTETQLLTTTQPLTTNIVEVRWNSAENLPYTITLKKENEDGTTEVSLTCGKEDNAKCKVYFLDLEQSKNYTASVTYKPKDISFTVAAEFMAEEPGIPQMTIKKFTEQTPSNFTATLLSTETISFSTLYIAIINSNEPLNPIETINFIKGDGEISQAEKDFIFTIDKSLLAQTGQLSLVITAHGADDKDEALGVARVNTEFEEILPPTINEVGTNSTLWVRVRTTMTLTVNDIRCPEKESTYFKKNDDFKAPLTLCRPAGKNLDEQEMQQCKIDGTIIPLPATISMRSIEMIYPKSGEPSLTFSGEFTVENQLEASYYNGSANVVSTCVINQGNCTIPTVTVTGDNYTFVIAALNESKVMGSTAVEFEDYKTNALVITEDIIQVSWNAKQKTRYDCYLDKEVLDSYNMLHVDCGAEDSNKCLAFFTDLDPKEKYTVRVNKQKNGELNIVGNEIQTSPSP